jgi:hypothetical protein
MLFNLFLTTVFIQASVRGTGFPKGKDLISDIHQINELIAESSNSLVRKPLVHKLSSPEIPRFEFRAVDPICQVFVTG